MDATWSSRGGAIFLPQRKGSIGSFVEFSELIPIFFFRESLRMPISLMKKFSTERMKISRVLMKSSTSVETWCPKIGIWSSICTMCPIRRTIFRQSITSWITIVVKSSFLIPSKLIPWTHGGRLVAVIPWNTLVVFSFCTNSLNHLMSSSGIEMEAQYW